jgi:hypothetical protein
VNKTNEMVKNPNETTETITTDSSLQHSRSARIVFQTFFHSIKILPNANFLMPAQTFRSVVWNKSVAFVTIENMHRNAFNV